MLDNYLTKLVSKIGTEWFLSSSSLIVNFK